MSNHSLIANWRRRWNQSLLKYLGRRVRAAVDVEDLAQETYLRLLRARDLGEVRNPQAYLLTIARHVIAEWREQLPVEDPIALPEDGELQDNAQPFQLGASLSQLRLEDILAEFPPLTEAVLLLRFRDEFSYKEIADRLDLSERQVRRHLTRGYERLRSVLEDRGGV